MLYSVHFPAVAPLYVHAGSVEDALRQAQDFQINQKRTSLVLAIRREEKTGWKDCNLPDPKEQAAEATA